MFFCAYRLGRLPSVPVEQVVRLPPGAERLADSPDNSNELWKIDDRVLCLQAHPEFNTSNQTTGFVAATRAGFKYRVDKDEFNPCKVFVGNLLWTTTVADMQNYFAQFGGIEDCKIMTDKYTNQSRGFGFVAFREEECT